MTNVLVAYATGVRDSRRIIMDAAIGFVSGFVGAFTGSLLFGLRVMGINAIAKYIWNVQINIWINAMYTALTTPPKQFLQSFGLGVLLGMATSIWP